MSPQIKIEGGKIITVPDESGTHMTKAGEIYVNVDGISADNRRQTIIVQGDVIGGRRILGLTHQGVGISSDPKRGDGNQPVISVELLDKPIRVSYKRSWDPHSIWERPTKYKETYRNPRWVRNVGRP